MSETANVHATGVVVDGVGVLIRGPSGAGKSLLALLLMDELDGRLVGDDRVDLSREGPELMMAPPAALAGKIELRGRGIVARPHVQRAAVHLVVDLEPQLIRMPESAAFETTLLGVALPRCPVPQAGVIPPMHQLLLVREALAQTGKDAGKKTT